MKKIAIVICCDTKQSETDYICEKIKEFGCKPFVIDVSTSAGFKSTGDIKREDVAKHGGKEWSHVEGGPQHELLDLMSKGARRVCVDLHSRGEIHGIFSAGGLQNTTIASNAMTALPIGFPKMIVSTVATGQRTFDKIVGIKDVTVMPSISDFAGINIVSKIIVNNAVAALVGMVQKAGNEIPKSSNTVIGSTLMGATNDGVVNAIKHLENEGLEVVSFHSTGAGGKVMEKLIDDKIINATMDMTLHEVVYEYFGYGFGFGADHRLESGVKNNIPMVVCPAGIDFMCQWENAMFEDISERKFRWHNSTLAHVKLKKNEVIDISNIIIDRLNQSEPGKVVVVLPTDGTRTFTQKGEELYDRKVDDAIIETFKNNLRKDIPLKLVDLNFMDPLFSKFVANEMLELLKANKLV